MTFLAAVPFQPVLHAPDLRSRPPDPVPARLRVSFICRVRQASIGRIGNCGRLSECITPAISTSRLLRDRASLQLDGDRPHGVSVSFSRWMPLCLFNF